MEDRFISKAIINSHPNSKSHNSNRKKLNTDTFKIIKAIKHEQKFSLYKDLLY